GRSDRASSSAWPVPFRRVTSTVEIAPGIRLVANRDPDGAFPETPELSLVLDTPDGQVVLVGCSHPGIERILESAHAGARSVAMLVGGLHLVTTPDEEIDRLVQALHTAWRVGAVAPGHLLGRVRIRRHAARLGRALPLRGRWHRDRASGSCRTGLNKAATSQ